MNLHYNLSTYFQCICDECAGRPALRYPGRIITYADLQQRAMQLAFVLRRNGVGFGNVIGIASSKQEDGYAMMLACLQMGVTYVHFDVTSPAERLEKICATCQPALIFADHAAPVFELLAKARNIPFLGPDFPDEGSVQLTTAERHALDGSTIAYIMYTSGSTGQPKGVAITHQNLLHFIAWSTSCYEVTPEDNFANLSPLYFDNSVFDFYTAFFSGASLTPIPRDTINHPQKLVEFISAMACTIWFSVPSLLVYLLNMKVLTGNDWKALRIISFGGEGFPKTELRKLYSLYSHRVRFINVYGPTECTCICSWWDVREDDFQDMEGLPPLGKLNQNFSCIIINEDGQMSTQGELYLLGPNVAAGYYNDPERSREVFGRCQHHPHLLKPQYKTGDLVRIKDGVLYFIGRKDNQIKHMGYRIELEEIEAAINLLPIVGQSAVVYQRLQDAYGKIIAFIVPDNAENPPDPVEMKKELKSLLPLYMIPNKIVVLEHLPKNSNGKVDRVLLKKGL